MNPEDHLVVRFLRFWKFNNAADTFVKSLFDPSIRISFHEDVKSAIAELYTLNNQLPLDSTSIYGLNTFFKNQNDLFEKVGNKYRLAQFSSVIAIDDGVLYTSMGPLQ
ncbi:hypothetical protein [Legionella sp. WA2022007384]